MQVRHATGVLLILVAGSLPGMGQGRPGSNRATYGIAGTVRDDYDQRTMENVRVDLKGAAGTPMNSTFTRGGGEFEFSGVFRGDYIIEIIVPDFEPFQESVTIEGADRRGLAVFLRRPMILGSAKSSGTISAHELSVPHKAHDEY